MSNDGEGARAAIKAGAENVEWKWKLWKKETFFHLRNRAWHSVEKKRKKESERRKEEKWTKRNNE